MTEEQSNIMPVGAGPKGFIKKHALAISVAAGAVGLGVGGAVEHLTGNNVSDGITGAAAVEMIVLGGVIIKVLLRSDYLKDKETGVCGTLNITSADGSLNTNIPFKTEENLWKVLEYAKQLSVPEGERPKKLHKFVMTLTSSLLGFAGVGAGVGYLVGGDARSAYLGAVSGAAASYGALGVATAFAKDKYLERKESEALEAWGTMNISGADGRPNTNVPLKTEENLQKVLEYAEKLSALENGTTRNDAINGKEASVQNIR
jgi:hypothetical protein